VISTKSAPHKIPWNLLIIFLILVIAINVLGYLYYENQKEQIGKEKQKDLSTIANLKVAQIVNWRKERLGDLSAVLGNPFIISEIHEWIHNPNNARQRASISTWMNSLSEIYHYDRIIIINSEGDIRLLAPEGQDVLGPNDKRLIGEAINNKRTIFSDIYSSENAKATRFSMIAPIIHPGGMKDRRMVPYCSV